MRDKFTKRYPREQKLSLNNEKQIIENFQDLGPEMANVRRIKPVVSIENIEIAILVYFAACCTIFTR